MSALNSSISSAKQSAIDTVNARINGGVGEFYQQSSLPSFSSLSWTDPKCQRHAGALWYATYPAPSGYTAGHLYRFTVMRGTGSKWEDVDDSIDTATTVTQNSDGWSVAAGMFSGQTLTAKGIATITPTVNSLCNSRIDDRKNEIRSGLVTTADFAALQTTVAGHTASISTSVQKDANGYITNASIKADRIKLEGLTTVNNYFKVLADGSIECVNADISGDLKVTNMRYAADIVVDGKVVYGSDGFAGELGHFVVDHTPEARSCGCGRKGCLETYTSATGVARTAREILEKSTEPSLLREIDSEKITSYDVFVAAEKGDKLALDIFNFTGRLLGTACADFATFCSPEAFVFFGGLTKAGEYLMKPLREAYEEHILFLYKGEAKLLISSLNGSEAAVLGASALGWE